MSYPDGSPADGVRVRVKAELTSKDNVYTSELISKGGQASFEIPSIPTAAQYVWLEVSSRARPSESRKAFRLIRYRPLLTLDQSDVHRRQGRRGPVPAQLPVHQQLVLSQQVPHPDPESQRPAEGQSYQQFKRFLFSGRIRFVPPSLLFGLVMELFSFHATNCPTLVFTILLYVNTVDASLVFSGF